MTEVQKLKDKLSSLFVKSDHQVDVVSFEEDPELCWSELNKPNATPLLVLLDSTATAINKDNATSRESANDSSDINTQKTNMEIWDTYVCHEAYWYGILEKKTNKDYNARPRRVYCLYTNKPQTEYLQNQHNQSPYKHELFNWAKDSKILFEVQELDVLMNAICETKGNNTDDAPTSVPDIDDDAIKDYREKLESAFFLDLSSHENAADDHHAVSLIVGEIIFYLSLKYAKALTSPDHIGFSSKQLAASYAIESVLRKELNSISPDSQPISEYTSNSKAPHLYKHIADFQQIPVQVKALVTDPRYLKENDDKKEKVRFHKILEAAFKGEKQGTYKLFSLEELINLIESHPNFPGIDESNTPTIRSNKWLEYNAIFLDLLIYDRGGNDTATHEKIRGIYYKVCNTGTLPESKKSRQNLTLLPLIINQLEPSLPVIIFSSTRHRSSLIKLVDKPAIVTHFSKPYLGDSSEQAEEYSPYLTLNELDTALRSVQPLIQIREFWCREMPKLQQFNKKSVYDISSPWNAPDSSYTSPSEWLEKHWLVCMQTGRYSYAATLPWIYLSNTFNTTLIEIMFKQAEISNRGIVPEELYKEVVGGALHRIELARFTPILVKPEDLSNPETELQKRNEYLNFALSIAEDLVTFLFQSNKTGDEGPEGVK